MPIKKSQVMEEIEAQIMDVKVRQSKINSRIERVSKFKHAHQPVNEAKQEALVRLENDLRSSYSEISELEAKLGLETLRYLASPEADEEALGDTPEPVPGEPVEPAP